MWHDSCALARIRLLKLRALNLSVLHTDFLSVEPRPTRALIYCDAPYFGTQTYANVNFDHEKFRVRVQQWAQYTRVFVSEYNFDMGVCIWVGSAPSGMSRMAYKSECLYMLEPR